MNDQETLENKKMLISIMQEENELLDRILEQQSILHECVKEKNWEKLNFNIENLQFLSDQFVELEERRTSVSGDELLKNDSEINPVLSQVRGKLQKSKIENKALNEYITITRKFLQGVFDSVVPQRRNTLYSNKGEIVKPELNSLVLNQLM